MENGEAGDGIQQRRDDPGQMLVEDARALRTAEDQEVGRDGSREREELRADGNAGDFGVAEPAGCRRKVDGGGLNTLADEAIGEAGHGIRLESHGRDFELQGRGHRRAGGVSAHAEDNVGPELSDQPLAGEDAAGQVHQCAQAGEQRYIFKLAYIHKFQIEAGLGHQATLHAARRADEEHFGFMVGDQFARHGQRRNNVTSGAAAGDE